MAEKTKIIILIISQTALITLEQAIEAILGKSAEIDFKTLLLIIANLLLCILFGLFTENTKRLFIYSAIISLVNIIFVSSKMYFDPNEYQKILPSYGDSAIIFLIFGFVFVFVISLFFMGLGRFLLYLFKVIFRKKADKV